MPLETRLRTVIVDDEAIARQRLARLLASDPEIELVAECADGPETLHVLRQHPADLLFLDVQMPEMDGFALLEALPPGRAAVVVMVTAYDTYAIRAFEARAIDYLLKPFHRPRFAQALERAKAQVGFTRGQRQPSGGERLTLRTGRSIVLLDLREIDWIEAAGNYVCVHCGRATHIGRETLASLEQRLSATSLVRIHRSVIVNPARVCKITPALNGDHHVNLKDGTRLAMSRTFRARLDLLLATLPSCPPR